MPQQRVVEDARLAVIATARQRAAAYGVDARQLCRDLVEQVHAGAAVDDDEAGLKGKRQRRLDAGSLVIEKMDNIGELQALDVQSRQLVYRSVLEAQPTTCPKRRRLQAPDDCIVCMEPGGRRVYHLHQHRCAVARGAMCLDCTCRLLSQRSPIECPLCRETLEVERMRTA